MPDMYPDKRGAHRRTAAILIDDNDFPHACAQTGCVLLLLCAGGCRAAPPPTHPGGAEEAAPRYYGVVLGSDWKRAYELLRPGDASPLGRRRVRPCRGSYRGGIGFEPESSHVRSCNEQGDEAKRTPFCKGIVRGSASISRRPSSCGERRRAGGSSCRRRSDDAERG